MKEERFGGGFCVDESGWGSVGATTTRYLVFESLGRPSGMKVCGVYGCLSIILMSKTASPLCCRSFRGEETNMFITGFASFFEGERG